MNNRTGYNGNPLLKSSNQQHQYTPEQIQEYMKCMNDPVYFVETYVKIVHVDRGLINFALYDYQKRIIRTIKDNRFTICKLPRQCGKSISVGCGSILHFVLFNSDKKVAILANKGDMAKKLLADIKKSFENLPKWLQQGIVEWNKTSVTFENGSKILVSTTTGDAGRGDSYAMVVLDEFAFVPENEAEDFFASILPTISSGNTTKLVIISTPYGLNHFYKMWTEAKEGRSGFIPIEINWWDTPGRDEAWKTQTINAWGGDSEAQRRFDQEYTCSFLGSTNTLLSGSCLAALAHRSPTQKNMDGLDVYVNPEKGHNYVVTVDVSTGNSMDYSAISVIDISQYPYRQVAKYRNNEVSALILPDILYRICTTYNNAWCLIELNQDGGQVANILHDEYEYENIIYVSPQGRKGQVATLEGFGKKVQFGVKTSVSTKRIGCSMLRSLMEGKKLIVEDYHTINELSTFVSHKKSFEADVGKHDDLVMSLVLFGWLTSQPIFSQLTDDGVKKRILQAELTRQEEMLTPMGFFDAGGKQEDPEPDFFTDSFGSVWKKKGREDEDDDWGEAANKFGMFF